MNNKQIAEDINRAELSYQVMSNEVYIQAMQIIQAKAFSDFTDSKADESEIRDQAWLQMQSHKEFKEALENIMEKGTFAHQAKQQNEANANFTDKDLYT